MRWAAGAVVGLTQLVLQTGPFIAASNAARGQPFATRDLFTAPFAHALPVVVVTAMHTTATLASGLLLVLPGIYLSVTLNFASNLWVEFHKAEGLGYVECLQLSRRLSHGVFWKLVCLSALSSVALGVAQAVALLPGSFAMKAVVTLAWASAFHQLFGFVPA